MYLTVWQHVSRLVQNIMGLVRTDAKCHSKFLVIWSSNFLGYKTLETQSAKRRKQLKQSLDVI